MGFGVNLLENISGDWADYNDQLTYITYQMREGCLGQFKKITEKQKLTKTIHFGQLVYYQAYRLLLKLKSSVINIGIINRGTYLYCILIILIQVNKFFTVQNKFKKFYIHEIGYIINRQMCK